MSNKVKETCRVESAVRQVAVMICKVDIQTYMYEKKQEKALTRQLAGQKKTVHENVMENWEQKPEKP